MKPNLKKLLIFLAIPLAVGGLAALLSGGFAGYVQLDRPPFSPPVWLFPIVWTALYLLMGYASYRAAESGGAEASIRKALTAYGVQLLLNLLWPIIFFRFGWYLPAFFLLIGLWIAIYITMHLFSKLDRPAADLLLPYLLWVCYAGYLNLGVSLLN